VPLLPLEVDDAPELPEAPEEPPDDVLVLPEEVCPLDDELAPPSGSGVTPPSVPLEQAAGVRPKSRRPGSRAEKKRGARTGQGPPARAGKQLKS
jgi:hypothetical protein